MLLSPLPVFDRGLAIGTLVIFKGFSLTRGGKKDIHGGNIWEANRLSRRPFSGILDFSASINPLGPPKAAVKAIVSGVKLVPPYPDPKNLSLKKAISESHAIPVASILPANGSTELIYHVPKLLKPGRALIIEPAFSEYARALAISGAKAEGFVLRERDGFRIDISKLDKRLSKGYSCLFMANPANPTGVLYGEDEVLEIIRLCRRRGAAAVIDEAFIDFSGGSVMRKAASSGAIVLRSMTKYYALAGLRLGYAVADGKTIDALSRLMPPWSVNTLASMAGVAALSDRAYTEKTAEWLSVERDYLFKGLSSIVGFEPLPSSANYVTVKITARTEAASLAARLFKKGLLIRDLSAFSGLGPKFFRVAVLKRGANRRLLQALMEIHRIGDDR